jgi:hypothetical protein
MIRPILTACGGVAVMLALNACAAPRADFAPVPVVQKSEPSVARLADAKSSNAEADELETDRPDFTEGPGVMAKGRVQVEAGETFGREDGVQSLSFGETLVRIGLSPRVELRVAANSYDLLRSGTDVSGGFEDMQVGLKFALLPEQHGWQPKLAVIMAATLPTGSVGMTAQETLPEVKVATGWDLTDRLALATNVNWSRTGDPGLVHDEWAASGSLGISLTERIGMYVEAFSFFERAAGWHERDYVNTGFTFTVTDNFQLDVRAGRGPSSAHGDFFTGVGFAHRW